MRSLEVAVGGVGLDPKQQKGREEGAPLGPRPSPAEGGEEGGAGLGKEHRASSLPTPPPTPWRQRLPEGSVPVPSFPLHLF